MAVGSPQPAMKVETPIPDIPWLAGCSLGAWLKDLSIVSYPSAVIITNRALCILDHEPVS